MQLTMNCPRCRGEIEVAVHLGQGETIAVEIGRCDEGCKWTREQDDRLWEEAEARAWEQVADAGARDAHPMCP